MTAPRVSLTVRDWNIKAEAAESYDSWFMDLTTMLSGLNALYLLGPIAGHMVFNPALPAAFVPSMNLPAFGYDGLTDLRKGLYNNEKTAYDRNLKIATDLRFVHQNKCGSGTSYLFSMLKQESVCCKSIFVIMKNGLTAGDDAGVIFRRMLDYIALAFAPNKVTDAAPLLAKLSAADFHDGRGLELNISEFLEAYDNLTVMNQAPVSQLMQKYVAQALKLYPCFMTKLGLLRLANEADDIAILAGGAPPVVPRWRTMLGECIADTRCYDNWDYITKGTSAGYQTKTKSKESTNINSNYDSKAPYCATCGRNGHSTDKCRAKKCICSKPIIDGKREHSVKDPAHDKCRREFVPFNKQSSTDPQIKSKEGDRDLSRRNPRDKPPGEKQLASQLKSNDKQNAKLTKLLDEGKRLVDQNLALRTAIERSTDTSLSNSMALIPYQSNTVFKSSSSSKSKKKRDRDDEEDESP